MNIFNPFIKRGPRKIIFVYSEKYKNTGSTIMRGGQLSNIISGNIKPGYDVTYEPVSLDVNNSYIVLTKGAIYDLSVSNLKNLKKLSNLLIFDPVDAPISLEKCELADVVIAASFAAYDSYLSYFNQSKIYILNHHVDPRIVYAERAKASTFKTGYFGELSNTLITPKIEKFVDFYGVDTMSQNNYWMQHVSKYPMHYCIRNSSNTRDKPFLKGFVAAHMNANVIIQETEKEAVYWLGQDYPFLVKAGSVEDDILHSLALAKNSYGSKLWETGLARMKAIKQRTSISSIANEFEKILDYLERM